MSPVLPRRETFFIPGRYIERDDGLFMTDQVFVERWTPPEGATQPLPVLMMHGGGQTAVNFDTTPDGRPGWAAWFVSRGYMVYIFDQPARGRSAYHPDAHPVESMFRDGALRLEELFTATADYGKWRQSALHTQWPGTGRVGDPVFDRFFASQVPWMLDQVYVEQLVREVGGRLLDQIGPAVLLTHSQTGPFGWHLADARPELVRGILAVEPNGPPYAILDRVGPPEYLRDGPLRWPYGITAAPITYDPPVTDPVTELPFVRDTPDDPTTYASCHLQAEPARQLVNLARVPVLVVTGEASYHAGYDHCTVGYLRQAGVKVTHVPLGEHGIHGNGHLMMMELNNQEVAGVLHKWLLETELAVEHEVAR
jgi:pimeloyl-ACP methyl ester carboxylesterase